MKSNYTPISMFKNSCIILILVIINSCSNPESIDSTNQKSDVLRDSKLLTIIPKKNLRGEHFVLLRLGETCSPCIEATQEIHRILRTKKLSTLIICNENCQETTPIQAQENNQNFLSLTLEETYEHGLYMSKNFFIVLKDGDIKKWWTISDLTLSEIKEVLAKY